MDDLAYLNADPARSIGRWANVAPTAAALWQAQINRVVRTGDDFVSFPVPQLAGGNPRAVQSALADYKKEAAVVDARLVRNIRLAVKGVAFNDLCRTISESTGIELAANASVADDKTTIFCEQRPLRDIMRQISRTFGFVWNRTGEPGAYRYELTQPLSAQLLEEELRNRDLNAALIALDAEMQKYRPFLHLTPDEALAQYETASEADKKLLRRLVGGGWAGAQLYFSLDPQSLRDLQDGKQLRYGTDSTLNPAVLPPALKEGILQGFHEWRVRTTPTLGLYQDRNAPGLPLEQTPGVDLSVSLRADFSEAGQISLGSSSFFMVHTPDGSGTGSSNGANLAVGVSPSVQNPDNAKSNVGLARSPYFRRLVSITPEPSCKLESDPNEGGDSGPRCTTADVLEAIHKASGMDIVADYYTRLYAPGSVSVRDVTLFNAICRVADTLGTRWTRENNLLAFRSTSFFNDRPKEIPNRLLTRWASSRRAHGILTLTDLTDISQLPAVQLGSYRMSEGARACYGLREWSLARQGNIREQWQFLAGLSPRLRELARSETGLSFKQLPPAQWQAFIAQTFVRAFGEDSETRPEMADLEPSTLHIAWPMPTPDPQTGQVMPVEESQDIKFVYRFGGPHTGRFMQEYWPRGSSMTDVSGLEVAEKKAQEAAKKKAEATKTPAPNGSAPKPASP